MRAISTLLIMAAFFACQKIPSSSKGRNNVAPEWISRKPVDNAYYIGIGQAKKSESDYFQQAKKIALEDMASEIKVTISASSFLHILDTDESFRDEYVSRIKTSVENELEGFERYDAWETETDYWVIYRLSKSYYQAQKRLKAENAKKIALDHYRRAQDLQSLNNVSGAIDSYVQSLDALKNYLAEPNEVIYEGRQIFLGNELSSSLQKLLDEVSIQGPAEKISLSREELREASFQLEVERNEQTIKNLPLIASFVVGKGRLTDKLISDEQGEANLIVHSVQSRIPQQRVKVQVDVEGIAMNHELDVLIMEVLSKFRPSFTEITLEVEATTVYLKSDEKNQGSTVNPSYLGNKVKSVLGDYGFVFSTEESTSQLVIEISADTSPHTQTNWFHVTYLDMVLSIIERSQNQEVYNTNVIQFKGRGDGYQKAGLDAYKKAVENLESDILPQIVKEIL